MKWLATFLTFFLFLACSSGFYRRERIYLSEDLAVYLIDEKDYPDDPEIKSLLKPVKPFPANSISILNSVWSNMKIEKKHIFSKDVYPVLYPDQIEEISRVLEGILPSVQNKRILVVHKYDPRKSVFSKEKRTTFLLWYDEDGYNFVVGESHEDLIPDSFAKEKDWLEIFPVSLKRAEDRLRILPADFLTFKKAGDFTHNTWVLFTEESVQKLLATKETEEPETGIEKKLKTLKDLYEKKLITREEYEAKRKEILKNF